MTRLQTTGQRKRGRTKRKSEGETTARASFVREAVDRLHRVTALGDGRARRRRRRRGNTDNIIGDVIVVDGSCNQAENANTRGIAEGGGADLVVNIHERCGGAVSSAIREGVTCGTSTTITSKTLLTERITRNSTKSEVPGGEATLERVLDSEDDLFTIRSNVTRLIYAGPRTSNHGNNVEISQHATVPDGQEVEGLSLAGSGRGSAGGSSRPCWYRSGTCTWNTADRWSPRETTAQA